MLPDLDQLLRESRSALPEPDPAATQRGIEVVLARVDLGRQGRRVGLLSAAIVGVLAVAASLAVAAGRIVGDGGRTQAVSASRIIDQTLVCRVVGSGYPDAWRVLRVYASPRYKSNLPRPGTTVFPAAGFGSDDPSPTDTTVRGWIRTGPLATWRTGEVALSQPPCTPTTVRVPLTRTALRGGPAKAPQADGTPYSCQVPARVLIRVRAVFKRPTTFRLRREPGAVSLRVAPGRIETGTLVVTTLAGRKPIFYASVDDATGKATMFVAPSRCSPDRG